MTTLRTPASTPRTTDPTWWRDAVVYQVYPRSFADTDGDGLGDVAGITSRVPYLAALGVDALWLSPFFPSPLADGGYDVADYRAVDPKLGSLDDLDTLVRAAHEHDLKVIVDIVPNHTSDQHEWFRAALASAPGSPERARYVFREGSGVSGELPPSDWVSNFGGSAWTRVPDGQWYLHLFAPEQPDLDWSNPEVRADFEDTLRFWSDRGVDGFRVDVAHGLAKDLSTPYRPSNEQDLPLDGSDPLYDRDEVHEIFATWRRVLDEYDPPRAAVAEAWAPAPRRVLYARPTELGQAFNFDLLEAPFEPDAFRRIIERNLAASEQSGASSTWVLSNHDVVRHPTRYGLPDGTDTDAWLMTDGTTPELDRAQGLRRARAATMLMLALPGSSYVYQGEELGLHEAAAIPRDLLQDPKWLRTGHTVKGRDGCRVPIPWTRSGPSFGFGDVAPHLPQPQDFGASSVEAEDDDPESTLSLYRRALAARRRLQQGEALTWLDSGSEVVAFARHDGWRSVTNFGTAPVPLPAGTVVVASGPLDGVAPGLLPGETTVWLA
ncbi:glycoside hydrolase family 13 protein [Curtobacterium flaccumfaciens]|uniref:glycoside hydrolase family 13 protein n=1 Tax=Curtobacterium flaccumfaciens TaxID=2035 RepID=UPI001266BCD4|nr:glycoside hydrolase family 13 protein [Curtobacterium flaccumfaciens]MBT1665456.1 glycoside hydrolase family 13 protein [Curtobacterium flaccumfaciens pv. flaccumfaciens]QFS79517.1 glycoside hydrolase family 13 protein [Curtobacterium flaccumfaciens pv. flaccumfaciens]